MVEIVHPSGISLRTSNESTSMYLFPGELTKSRERAFPRFLFSLHTNRNDDRVPLARKARLSKSILLNSLFNLELIASINRECCYLPTVSL